MESLEELLRDCTVRVLGPRRGAGFFIAPGIVLTCAHVVGAQTTLTIDWDAKGIRNHSASVPTTIADRGRPIPAFDSDYPDVALVHVDGLDGHPCVAIDPDWPGHEDRFQIYGYPEEGGSAVLTPAVLTYRGKKGSEPTVFLDLASDQVKRGMSGAAVLNFRSQGVCGLVVASKDIGEDRGALAVTWGLDGRGTDLSSGREHRLPPNRLPVGVREGHRRPNHCAGHEHVEGGWRSGIGCSRRVARPR